MKLEDLKAVSLLHFGTKELILHFCQHDHIRIFIPAITYLRVKVIDVDSTLISDILA